MKKKYLILADGTSTHTMKWIKELVKSFEIYLVSFNGISEQIKKMGTCSGIFDFKINVNVKGSNYSALKHVVNVASIIKKVNPDYINAHYITSYGTVAVLAAMLCGYKRRVILSTWGTDILVTPWKNKVYFGLTKFLLNKASIVTSDSNYMTEIIHKIVKNVEVMTFPFGIESMPEVSFSEKNYQLCFSNRALEKNYNVDVVIKYFAEMHKVNSNIRLVIAHDGTEKQNLVKLVKSYAIENKVDFVGFLNENEQKEYYRKSGYYFSLPASDSTSVSLLEAMAYGCIPIVSDIPANKEWIINGENGLIVKDSICLEDVDERNAFKINRNIILKKAIWSDNIINFVNKIDESDNYG